MNEQLRQLKKRLKREEQIEGEATEDGTSKPKSPKKKKDALANSGEKSQTNDVNSEREEILSMGKRFIRPLTMDTKKSLKITGSILAGLLLLTIIVIGVFIYHFKSDSDFIYRASQIIPYPAARVDGTFITYNDYLFELNSLKQYSTNPIGGGEGVDFETEEGQKQLENMQVVALSEAQRKMMVRKIADEKDVEVSEEALNEKVNEFIENEGGEKQLKEALERFYGWDLRDFKSVLHDQLLQQEIVRKRAENIREKAKSDGSNFAELAKKHSSDGSAQDGGNVGYVKEGSDFVPEFEKTALTLEKGEISEVIETKFGFHILKATDKDPKKGVKISHILVSPAFIQEEISNRLEEASKTSYIGVSLDTEDIQTDVGAESTEEAEQTQEQSQ